MTELLTMRRVGERLAAAGFGTCEREMRRLRRDPKFPKGVIVSASGKRYKLEDVDKWIEMLKRTAHAKEPQP